MTVERVRGSDGLVVGSRSRLTEDAAAVLLGMSVSLCVLAGALLTARIVGFDFRVSGLHGMAAAAIPTAIVLVLAAFFCGGWAYSALRAKERRS